MESIKMRQLVGCVPTLQRLAAEQLSAQTIYRVSALLDALGKNLDFYNDRQRALLKQYGAPEDDGTYSVPPDQIDAFKAKVDELLDVEVDLSITLPVRIPTTEKLTLSYNDIVQLRGLIELTDTTKAD